MELKIKDKDIELNFGMKFIRELNKKAGMWTNGVNIGMALQKTLPAVLGGDPEAIATVLYCATAYIKSGRPKEAEIDEFMDECEDFDTLQDDLLDALKEGSLTKAPLAKMMAQASQE